MKCDNCDKRFECSRADVHKTDSEGIIKKAYFGIEHPDADYGYGIVAESVTEAKKLLFEYDEVSTDIEWINIRVSLRPSVNVGNLPIGIVEDVRLCCVAGFCSMIRDFPCDVCGRDSDVEMYNGKVVCEGCREADANGAGK
jgi:hypothetical protein